VGEVLDGVATNQTPQFTEGFQVFQLTPKIKRENLACSRPSRTSSANLPVNLPSYTTRAVRK
jgi:hypothetical protein